RALEAEDEASQDRDRAREAEQRAYEHAAERALAQGDWPSALDALDKALVGVAPGEDAQLRLQRGKAHWALHQVREAHQEIEALSRRTDLGDLEGPVVLWRADIDMVRLLSDRESLKKVDRACTLTLPPAERDYAEGLRARTMSDAIKHFQSA